MNTSCYLQNYEQHQLIVIVMEFFFPSFSPELVLFFFCVCVCVLRSQLPSLL